MWMALVTIPRNKKTVKEVEKSRLHKIFVSINFIPTVSIYFIVRLSILTRKKAKYCISNLFICQLIHIRKGTLIMCAHTHNTAENQVGSLR
ncbi:hypothetical protein EUTSA_v10003298mg [Eutrema salsugineum]|uniref:Uncharacterized protein n=1 Tax=Eutrema salsugineum TaxID=72664 RepID=V4L2U8_EUTSA|nr:hypothetical protein EUTSA_v10003298mg [Eutrema salsugineum]